MFAVYDPIQNALAYQNMVGKLVEQNLRFNYALFFGGFEVNETKPAETAPKRKTHAAQFSSARKVKDDTETVKEAKATKRKRSPSAPPAYPH